MGDFDIESLTDALCEEYEVSKEKAYKDVQKMVNQWQELKIVE